MSTSLGLFFSPISQWAPLSFQPNHLCRHISCFSLSVDPFPATVSTGGRSRRLAGPLVTSSLPSLLMQAQRRSLRSCVNMLCDVRWSDEAPTASSRVLQMTQGSPWHRVLLLGGARTLASISFCCTSWDHWKKSGDGGWWEVLFPAPSSQSCLQKVLCPARQPASIQYAFVG